MKDPVVLLVDDDEDFLHIARRAISRAQIQADVRAMTSGTEALRFLGLTADAGSSNPPPNLVVVFVDLDMPLVTGWEILRRVRANTITRDLPVVVVSSSARPLDMRHSYDLGANSYLVKQFDPAEPGRYVARAIRYWCELNRVPGWRPGADSLNPLETP
jgi:two-component system response regulator